MSQNQQIFEHKISNKNIEINGQRNQKQQDIDVGTKLKYNLPKKIVANALDDVGTKKLKQADSFSFLCDRILSETQKLNKLITPTKEPLTFTQEKSTLQEQLEQSPSPNLTYDPHYHTGLIQNYIAVTSQEEKYKFGLGNEGRCQHFELNGKFLVVIVGRLPTDYCSGMRVGLYLPRQLVQNPVYVSYTSSSNSNNTNNNNTNTITIPSNKQLVLIQRRSLSNDTNFLNYAYIILQPQILLYPSYLCSWIQCKRRVSLVNYITSQFQVNQHLVFGSACHRYMEWLLDKQVKVSLQSYQQWKQTVIKKVYQSFLYDMFLVKATFERFFQYCQQSLTNIRQWVRMFIVNKKQLEVNKYQRLYLRIQNVIGSQTMHRSGYFGLKGKTDGLFKGKLINKKTNTTTEVYIPFQLKTGKKPSQSHKRQTDIYNMLLRQRQKLPVIGLLYYSQSNITIFRQQNKQVAFQTIVIHRNTIVMNLKRLYKGEQILLPQMTTNGDNCKLCEMAVACEVVEQNNREKSNSDLKKIQDSVSKKKKKQFKQIKYDQNLHQRQENNEDKQAGIQISPTKQKAMLLNSLFDSQSSSQQQKQQLKQQKQQQPNKHQIKHNSNQTNTLLPLPSTHNIKAKQTLQLLSNPLRRYLNKWLQMLHLQQREIKQQLQKSTAQGYGNFILTSKQIQKINKYFHQTKLQQKLTFSIQKRYRSLEQLHKLLSNYTVSLKLRIIIQHLGIMQGCKIIKITKLQNKLLLQVEMNSLQVVMNRRALTYSVENKVEHDVELERFQSLQVAGWRWIVYKFVLGQNQRLKQLVVDQYQSKDILIQKSIQQQQQIHQQQQQQQVKQKQSYFSNLNKPKGQQKQSQSTVDITNKDIGSKQLLNITNQPNNNQDLQLHQQQQQQQFQLSQIVPLQQNKTKISNQQIALNIKTNNNQHNVQLTQNLNVHQLKAFNKVFSPQSFCTLVQGMPGTGKTQLIVKLILQAYLLNQTVLITTYTNRSLDNILQRVFNQSLYHIPQSHIIRQGSRYSIDPKFQKLNHRYYQFTTVEQYNKYFIQKKLWFVTLSSINIHHIPKQFDLVILDQASQSLQPVCLQALCRGSKFVMIGDYKQLQPIVKSKKANVMGMGISLFQRLCIKYPQMTVALRMQYRMNEQIMRLSNKLVYDGQLQMGSRQVSQKRLQLPEQWFNSINQQTLKQIICPSNPVTFLNHDGITNSLSSRHRHQYNQMSHVLQIQCGVFIYQMLLKLGVKQQQMQIVCVYNRTVDVVNQMLARRLKKVRQQLSLLSSHNSTPALTIDKSQGIDKEVIILLVQAQSNNISANNNNTSSLLENSRRLNVALTRAKSKLILIGSMRHLKQMQVWRGQLALMLEQKTYSMTKTLIDYILGQFSTLQIIDDDKGTQKCLQNQYQQMQKQLQQSFQQDKNKYQL